MTALINVLRLALSALGRNVLRSALTTLGIVIGVAAVIAMVEIGQGASVAVQQTILNMGANNLLIQPGTATSGGGSLRRGRGPPPPRWPTPRRWPASSTSTRSW